LTYLALSPAGEVSSHPPQKLFRADLAGFPNYDYYFVYMKYLTRQCLKLLIATAALVFGLAAGAPAQDPDALQRHSVNDTSHRERTTAMQTAKSSPDVKIPPLDAAVPARTETATFGLG
jgi:hypothetical protein